MPVRALVDADLDMYAVVCVCMWVEERESVYCTDE